MLRALAPRPAPAAQPLTWSPDALRALEQHAWPGNVTEPAHLVRALAGQRRFSGPVRRGDLPDPVREGPAGRSLSPLELAERAAILEALRHHGGSKVRAAAALGIGRATLCRKLRVSRSDARCSRGEVLPPLRSQRAPVQLCATSITIRSVATHTRNGSFARTPSPIWVSPSKLPANRASLKVRYPVRSTPGRR